VLAVIRFARAAGFTMTELKELFRGFREGTPASARWPKLARHKIAEMDALINKATTVKRMLRKCLRCRCITLEDCGRPRLRWAKIGGSVQTKARLRS
jgi:DNA-binding transcriptional MerR regulator